MTTDTTSMTTPPRVLRAALRRGDGNDVVGYGIFGAYRDRSCSRSSPGQALLSNNVAALFQQNAYVMILAIGMVMVIVAGHIDLSVGSVVAFIGGIVALAMRDLQPTGRRGAHRPRGRPARRHVAGLQCLRRDTAFIVTLAGMLLFRGLAIVLVGETVAGLPRASSASRTARCPHGSGTDRADA